MRKFEELEFHNLFNELGMNFSTAWLPAPSPGPALIAFNEEVARLLDLDPEEARRPVAADLFCGNRIFKVFKPLVQIYAGHDFGTFVQRRGDGRCILLGEILIEGEQTWDLQLKGAGPTPLSQGRDGRCSLTEAVREYVGGEALHALGIPTTRALSIVTVDEEVKRAERVERAAALLRIAPTLVRFGHYEYFSRLFQKGWVRNLVNHVIRIAYPDIPLDDRRYGRFLGRVVDRTADLVASWQAEGFCHGQMNTDDMSIVGLTLDYDTFGFQEAYDPGFAPNPADASGRYAFERQPDIALWNLARLGECVLDFVSPDEAMGELEKFRERYRSEYRRRMRAKLGLERISDEDLDSLVADLLGVLHAGRADYTRFFRRLADFSPADAESREPLRSLFADPAPFDAWIPSYVDALSSEGSGDEARGSAMLRVNPGRVLRRTALDDAVRAAAEQGDPSAIERLRRYVAFPFEDED